MTIERIVEEVIRRLKALENRKNLLLVVNDDTDYNALKAYFETINRDNLKVGIISYDDVNPAIEILKDLNVPIINMVVDRYYLDWDKFLLTYDAVMVSGLSVGQMYNLSVLNINGPFEKLIWDLIVSDKKVYGLKSVNTKNGTQVIKGKVEALYGQMAQMGIHWLGEEKAVSGTLKDKLITVHQLTGYSGCELIIPKDAIVTPLAKDQAIKEKIQLVRK